MRVKSLPLSVRTQDPRPGRAKRSESNVPARPRQLRDILATLVMVALVPALVLTGQTADAATGAPTVVGRSIVPNASGVSVLSEVAVRFDRPVTGVGPSTFTLRDGSGRTVPATIKYDPATFRARLIWNDSLKPNRGYGVSLTSGIRALSGAALRGSSWTFTTGMQPSSGTRFSPSVAVHFDPGTITGIKIDPRGAIVARKTATLSRASWATAATRATINGRTYFGITNGIWAGYFVPRSAGLSPLSATPSSSPRPSPAPTLAPTATPDSGAPTPTATAEAPTASPAPTVAPSPTAPPPAISPPSSGSGIVISAAELRALPASGPTWDALKRAADGSAGTPNLADLNQANNVLVLAKSLVYARTGLTSYRTEVIAALRAAIGTEANARTLDLGRELAAYVIAADLIGLRSADPAFDTTFRGWLRGLLDRQLADGNSLTDTHERRPNNWGTHAGASRAAVAAYLGDTAELARVATVFRGWVGERSTYAGFSYSDLWWQSDPSQPVGINPPGAVIAGRNVDGVLPDDQRRTGEFAWPAPCGNYPHGAMDGALLTAEILTRAGYPAYGWGSNALLRAEQWLHATACAPSGDNVWQLPLLDARYGTNYWNGAVVRPGKNFGWTDWLYGS